MEVLYAIPGVGCAVAEVIVAEIGVEMRHFARDAHLSSWAGMCSGDGEQLIEVQINRAREHTVSILHGCANTDRELSLRCRSTGQATSSLSPVFCDFDAAIFDVEDLSPNASRWLKAMDCSAAPRADFGSVNDDLMGLLDLSQSRSCVTELPADFQSRLLSERTSALDLLPWQIKRGRER